MKGIAAAALVCLALAGCGEKGETKYLGRSSGPEGTFDVTRMNIGWDQPYVYVARRVDPAAPGPGGVPISSNHVLDPPVVVSQDPVVIRINPGFSMPYLYLVPGASAVGWRTSSGKTQVTHGSVLVP